MALIATDTGVVVLAAEHNPTILHPSFLASRGIVDPEWEVVDQPITTPALSQVRYRNGIAFLVERSKLQLLDVGDYDVLGESPILDLAARYVEALPHVPYTAVGINFTLLLEGGDPAGVIVDRFLKPGPWTSEFPGLTAMTPRLTYDRGDCTLNLDVKSGTVTLFETKEEREGIVLHANYHHPLPEGTEPVRGVHDILARAPDLAREFTANAETIEAYITEVAR